jgi:hypothetical protein
MSRVILMMATLACAIITPAAGVTLLLPSSVFAQQEDTSLGEREDLASGIVSGVLDGSSDDEEDDNIDNEENEGGGAATAGDDDAGTNAQIAVPITDQDQRDANLDANLAAQLGLNADIVEEVTPIPTPTPTEEEPPEFVTFCFLSGNFLLEENTLLCYPTMEDCKLGEVFFAPVIEGQVCKGFETRPPDAGDCEIIRDPPVTGVPTGSTCTLPT